MAIGNNLTPLQTTSELKKIKTKIDTIETNAQVNKIETIKVNNTAQTITSKAVNITVPTKTSQITNDSNFAVDSSYVHTDNNYTTTEKNKLDYTNIAYGTCTTEAATASKVITISENSNWELKTGSVIVVLMSNTNTANNPTFNVNSTGAKNVFYGTTQITTSSLNRAGLAGSVMVYIYDGTQYRFISKHTDDNTTYTNASLGQGYGTCTTEAATAAKVVTLTSYSLVNGGVVSVKFTNSVPANATMNINGKGAKSIYYKGAAIEAGVIEAGDVATFLYNSNIYYLISIDTKLITATERTKLNGIAAGATKVEASSNNGKIKINGTETTVYTKPALTKSEVTTALGYTPPTQDTNTTYTLTQDSTDGHKITFTPSSGNATTITIPDNNTTYTGSNGISLSGTTFSNSGVRSIAQGTSNGTISVNTNGTSADVSVKGLSNAAYKDVDTTISDASTSTKLPTSKAVAVFVEGKGYKTTDNNTTYTLTQDSSDGHKITLTPSTGTATTITIPDNNTTYTGSNGISLSGTTFSNSGVRSVTTGDSNGQIKVNTNGTSTNVSVKGLQALAYKASLTASDVGAIASSLKGAVNGVAELDENGLVPSSQLPSYVDDVVEGYYYNSKFYKESAHTTEITGEAGKIYVDLSTNKTYRYSGSAFVVISETLALGTTSSTAFRGDYGNSAYTHAVTNKGSAFTSGLYKITTNSEGHVTAATAVQKSDITGLGIPGSDSDTKNTAGSTDSSKKLFLIGAETQAANPQTYSQDTAYVGTDGHLYSNGVQVVNLSSSQALTNKTYNGYTLAAASAKGVDTSIAAGSTSTNLPTSKAVNDFVVGKGYVTTDTKNTAGSTDTSSKIYLVGATTQAANPQTYSDNEVFATNGILTSKSFSLGGNAEIQYNSTDKCIEFVFA